MCHFHCCYYCTNYCSKVNFGSIFFRCYHFILGRCIHTVSYVCQTCGRGGIEFVSLTMVVHDTNIFTVIDPSLLAENRTSQRHLAIWQSWRKSKPGLCKVTILISYFILEVRLILSMSLQVMTLFWTLPFIVTPSPCVAYACMM